MALGLYGKNTIGQYVRYSNSNDTSYSNPITSVHDGRNGTTREIKLYVMADDDHEYTNIEVRAVSTSDDIGEGQLRGDTGWGVKLMTDPGRDPTEHDWESVEYGESAEIADISELNSIRALWYRVESPRGVSVQNKENITLQLYCTDGG